MKTVIATTKIAVLIAILSVIEYQFIGYIPSQQPLDAILLISLGHLLVAFATVLVVLRAKA